MGRPTIIQTVKQKEINRKTVKQNADIAADNKEIDLVMPFLQIGKSLLAIKALRKYRIDNGMDYSLGECKNICDKIRTAYLVR
jgi:hypothetical protein